MLDTIYLDNSLLNWLTAAGIAVAAVIGAAVLRRVLHNRIEWIAQRTETRIDDALANAVAGTRLLLVFVVAAFVALQPLELPSRVDQVLRVAALLATFLQVGIWASRMLDHWIESARQRAMQTDAATATSLVAFKFIGRLLLWSVLVLVALDNVGVDVTALVAGLGIGGVALALAVQNILGDLFASMSILVDKPFVIGDFIIVGDFLGTVEHIGLKTTRVRSLGGEQLIFSNGDLLSSRIRNYKRMAERRIVFPFGVLYQTPVDQLEALPGIVRGIIEAQPNTRFDRAHLQKFGDSSYDFEVVYWMLTPDYNQYMDTQQAINLAMVRAFAERGIEFAYPTRTVYLQREPVDAAERQDDERTAAAGNGAAPQLSGQ